MKFVWRIECERERFTLILPLANEATLQFRWHILQKRGAFCQIQPSVERMTLRKVADTRSRLRSPKSNSLLFLCREHRFRGAWLALQQEA
jgi:hypothetical protein